MVKGTTFVDDYLADLGPDDADITSLAGFRDTD